MRAVGSFLWERGGVSPWAGRPLTLDGSSARMRSEGGGFAANIYRAMPESGGSSDTGKRISNIRGSQPRLATLDSPFQRKGRECGAFRVYRSLLPLEGGARRAEVRGAERSEKGASQAGDLRKHPSAADAFPLPRWGRQISSGFSAK